MVSSCCFCCLSAPRLLSSASCFEIHLEGRWCSRWDRCFISLHTVQLEIWDAIGIAFLFRSSLFQAKHRWRRPQVFLMNVPPITFPMKDRLSILWREWSGMVNRREPLLPISGLYCEMKLMCDVGCRLSFLIQNLLKSWRTKWGFGFLGAGAAPVLPLVLLLSPPPLLPLVLVTPHAGPVDYTGQRGSLCYFYCFCNLMDWQDAKVPTYLQVSFCEDPLKCFFRSTSFFSHPN